MGKWSKIGIVFLLFIALCLVRFFEERLFYDPLLVYFKGGYLEENQLPSLQLWEVFISISFRFWLNTIISLLILYVAFAEVAIVKFSLVFYVFVYIVLLSAYFYLLNNYSPDRYLTLFYVRRFLIQPLFVILLLPAFYYQSQIRE
ncbi:exosortase F system-associated membrane protein [Flavimarina sp. Hel_I_48]|uniref:exosortase F system-associated membrane protein n=1 Tax=Flavimarina sp. Hel_I_48 TaxID=1392488 RepID=UPI0004DF99E0|nr:exosortase F system-associated protein [Flavimarina sp. Hel_I_48]